MIAPMSKDSIRRLAGVVLYSISLLSESRLDSGGLSDLLVRLAQPARADSTTLVSTVHEEEKAPDVCDTC